jgi:hypothetical protein
MPLSTKEKPMKTIVVALTVAWTVFAVGSAPSFAAPANDPAAPAATSTADWCKDDYRGH